MQVISSGVVVTTRIQIKVWVPQHSFYLRLKLLHKIFLIFFFIFGFMFSKVLLHSLFQPIMLQSVDMYVHLGILYLFICLQYSVFHSYRIYITLFVCKNLTMVRIFLCLHLDQILFSFLLHKKGDLFPLLFTISIRRSTVFLQGLIGFTKTTVNIFDIEYSYLF